MKKVYWFKIQLKHSYDSYSVPQLIVQANECVKLAKLILYQGYYATERELEELIKEYPLATEVQIGFKGYFGKYVIIKK